MRLENLIMTLTSQIMQAGKNEGMPKGEMDVLISLLSRIQNMIGDGIQPHELETLGKLLGKAGDMIQDPALQNAIKKIQKKLKYLKETGLLEHLLKDPAKAGFGGGAGGMLGAGMNFGSDKVNAQSLTSDAISGPSETSGVQQPNLKNPFEEVHPDQINSLFSVEKSGLMDNEYLRKAGETYKAMRREIAEDAIEALLHRSMDRVMGIESTETNMAGNSDDLAHKTTDDALDFQLQRLGNLGAMSGVSLDNGQVSQTAKTEGINKVGSVDSGSLENARSMQHDAESKLQETLNNLVKPETENKITGDVDLQSRVGSANASLGLGNINPTPPSDFGSVV